MPETAANGAELPVQEKTSPVLPTPNPTPLTKQPGPAIVPGGETRPGPEQILFCWLRFITAVARSWA